jgi:hypothetical protein
VILDLADLQKLSGYKRATDIKTWLRKNGVAFMVQPSGHPVTTLDAVNLALSPKRCRTEPNWAPIPAFRRTRSAK